ncbi:hypothetical protein ARTHRO9V_90550 [Arthrobacter sp. 9V]|nr:hypothetical protein ARTHRO9V_90550 [Arthrobacter sp. 9V]
MAAMPCCGQESLGMDWESPMSTAVWRTSARTSSLRLFAGFLYKEPTGKFRELGAGATLSGLSAAAVCAGTGAFDPRGAVIGAGLGPQPARRTPAAINGASMRNAAGACRIFVLHVALVLEPIMVHGTGKIQHLDLRLGNITGV